VVATIRHKKPDVVFAPHVETSAGMILPDDYLRAVADAVHAVGGLFVLDCIASGALWVNMEALGVDVLVTAPQKGWSGSPCCAMVMLSARARAAIDGTTSTSFACDLKKWLQIMETYEKGGHAYHATMPTDALIRLREVMEETRSYGFEKVRQEQIDLGSKVRILFERRGIQSVAAPGFKAPGVVVSYTADPEVQSSKKFLALGLQTAAGVPLQCDEPADFMTFRVGLFGLEKLHNVDRTVAHLASALDAMGIHEAQGLALCVQHSRCGFACVQHGCGELAFTVAGDVADGHTRERLVGSRAGRRSEDEAHIKHIFAAAARRNAAAQAAALGATGDDTRGADAQRDGGCLPQQVGTPGARQVSQHSRCVVVVAAVAGRQGSCRKIHPGGADLAVGKAHYRGARDHRGSNRARDGGAIAVVLGDGCAQGAARDAVVALVKTQHREGACIGGTKHLVQIAVLQQQQIKGIAQGVGATPGAFGLGIGGGISAAGARATTAVATTSGQGQRQAQCRQRPNVFVHSVLSLVDAWVGAGGCSLLPHGVWPMVWRWRRRPLRKGKPPQRAAKESAVRESHSHWYAWGR